MSESTFEADRFRESIMRRVITTEISIDRLVLAVERLARAVESIELSCRYIATELRKRERARESVETIREVA